MTHIIEIIVSILLAFILLPFIIFDRMIGRRNYVGSHASRFVLDMRADHIRRVYEFYGRNMIDAPDKFAFSHIDMKLPYVSMGSLPRHSLHIGQFKLFISELRFINAFISGEFDDAGAQHQKSINDPFIVVYSGSAPGHHDAFLAQLFPNMRMVLIDPAYHKIENHRDTAASSTTVIEIDPVESSLYFKFSSMRNEKHIYPDSGTSFVAKNGEISVLEDPTYEKFATQSESALLSGALSDITTEERHVCAATMRKQICGDMRAGSSRRFYISEDYFGDEYASEFARITEYPVIYISDIRSESVNGRPSDIDIIANNAQQHMWIRAMRPVASMVKFRTPFRNAVDTSIMRDSHTKPFYARIFTRYKEIFGIDLPADYLANKPYHHVQFARLDLQAFPGPSSTEARAFISRANIDNMVDVDSKDYEERFVAYNLFREFAFYAKNRPFFTSFGIDGCADCNIMIDTFVKYLTLSMGKSHAEQINIDARVAAVQKFVSSCLMSFGRTLIRTSGSERHGTFKEPISQSDAIRFA